MPERSSRAAPGGTTSAPGGGANGGAGRTEGDLSRGEAQAGGGRERLRDRFMGIDESFSVKSYYPQLKERLRELEAERTRALESEARLAKLNTELESLVESRTAALRSAMSGLTEANAELERTLSDLRAAQDRLVLSEKMAAVGRLVAGIAHDVNSPLGALLSSVSSIDEGLQGYLEGFPAFYASLGKGDFGRYLGLVAAGAEKARSLESGRDRARKDRLAELLAPECPDALSVAEAAEELGVFDEAEAAVGEIGFRRAARILAEAAKTVALIRSAAVAAEATRRTARIIEALRRFSLGSEAKSSESIALREEFAGVLSLFQDKFKHELVVDLDMDEEIRVSGDREALGQVWIGLVANALQAMEYRGRLGLSAREEGGSVLVSVSDTGRGIRPEDRDRVFEPFFTTKKLGEGMGLSLSIARKVVEANGGEIDFESEPGRTVFRVRLKAARK